MLRRLWPLLIGLAASGFALAVFDWGAVARAALAFDLAGFLAVALPATLLLFAARSLRWVAVAGLSFAPAALWRAHAQTALAIASAAATPLQAGEMLKLKLARDDTGEAWARLGAAFALERVADISALLAIGALGFGLAGASGAWLAAAALAVVLAVALAPALLRRLARLPLPPRLGAPLAPLAQYRPSAPRMLLLALGTTLKWAAVLSMWQAVFAATGIRLDFAQCAQVLVLVTLSVTVSMVPGGLGVAEVSARAVLVWLGIEPGVAEAGALLLRLQLPLLVGIGLLHALALRPEARHG